VGHTRSDATTGRHGDSGRQGGVALVLGGGGRVGLAYHGGVLRALRDEAGFDAGAADDIIGTSAGSLAGAYVRLGRTPEELAAISYSVSPPNAAQEPLTALNMVRAWDTRPELMRRMIGASSVMARSVVLASTPASFRRMTAAVPARAPDVLGRVFPGWLFDPEVDALSSHIPEEWPDGRLSIVAFDIHARRRVVLDRENVDGLGLARAVMSSCAVPGMIRPVRVGNMVLVDGGTTSVNNIDLAARTRPRAVIAVAPMAYDPLDPPSRSRMLARTQFNRSVERERTMIRRTGADVIVIRPGRDELVHHARNLLQADRNTLVEESAFESTTRLLRGPDGRRFFDDLARRAKSGER
jgi:NTE family protein